MKLYFAKNTAALAPHITLLEVGAAFEAREIDFSQGEQRSADYLAINRKGRVPALETEHGILTETPAVLVYIAQRYPEQNLARLDDPFEFGRIQEFNSFLCSTVHVAHAHRMRGHRWTDNEAAQKALTQYVPTGMSACCDLIEQFMSDGPWVMGDHYTISDPYLFTLSRWLEGDQVDITKYPRLSAHFNRMSDRPAVREAVALHH